ncbi:MAG: ABC transporter permease [Anaerolineaceae bacterium]|nr:ABC transporter permease [Anaerolineaceae bacterium]
MPERSPVGGQPAAAPAAIKTLPENNAGAGQSQNQWYFVRRQLRQDKAALLGGAILLIIIALTMLADSISPFDPLEQSRDGADLLVPPNAQHWMGTDDLRRDVFSRVLHGGRTTISVGVVSISAAISIGLALGLMAGYFGGGVDDVISRFLDIMLTLPAILMAIVVVTILGAGLQNAMLAVSIASMPAFARLVRGDTLVEKNKIYVESSRAMGASHWHIMWQHILPNVVSSVIVVGTLRVASAIQIAAGLSFLGLGAQIPHPEWGAMLSLGRNYIRSGQWWMTVFPGLAIFITVMCINLLGDGLRDALDPRLRGTEQA